MEIHNALEGIGLTNNEIKVYLALIELGGSLAGNISKKANLHRRPTYDSLQRLVEKGLVSYAIQAGKKSFQAVNPERALQIVKEKEEKIKEILPSLKEKFNSANVKVFAEIYDGKEGIKTIMEDILKENKEWLTISAGQSRRILPYYLDHFIRQREKQKMKRITLIADSPVGRAYAKELKAQKYVEIRVLPKFIQNPQTMWIYGNKVVTVFVSIEHPVSFLIENKNIAQSYRDYFNMMWKHSKAI